MVATSTGADSSPELGDAREATATIGVAGWTLISRVSGLARVAVAGATLGPTFFANIFQATNTVPNITYNLMAGSLLTTLIVPSFVEALDEHGIERARELARNLTGVVIAGFTLAAIVVLAFGPVIVHLLTLGVANRADAAQAQVQTWVLLLLVLPQIVLYGIIAVAIAAQNARGHFALAAAAPAVENIGLIITLLVAARMYGIGLAVGEIPTGFLIILGAGATLAVVAHAGLQCFGAARAGLPLWPRWGWRDQAVRLLCRRTVPTIGTASLDAAWLFALIVASGTVPGGVVAFQIGMNFYGLPMALSAKAVGTVLLPHLARDAIRDKWKEFRATYERGLAWSWFLAVPASVALFLLAKPIAQGLAFGAMQRDDGPALVTASVAVLGCALIGASINAFARHACYARHDVIAPLAGGGVLFVITLIGAPIAVTFFGGAAALAALGVVVVISETARAILVDRAARRGTPHHPMWAWRTLGRDALASVVAIAPAALLARFVDDVLDGHVGALAAVLAATAAGLVGYLGLQALLGAPELPERVRRSPRLERVGAMP